jgi:hypothetical protein
MQGDNKKRHDKNIKSTKKTPINWGFFGASINGCKKLVQKGYWE